MSGWEIGDLALCIAGGKFTRAGSLYTVRDVKLPDEKRQEGQVWYVNNSRCTLLRFAQTPHLKGQWASEKRFIKVTPPEADEFDRETIDLYRGTPITLEQRDAEFFAKIDSKVRRQMQGDD